MNRMLSHSDRSSQGQRIFSYARHSKSVSKKQLLWCRVTVATRGNSFFCYSECSDWPADAWGAKKSLVLASLTPLGGPNMPLAIVTLFSG